LIKGPADQQRRPDELLDLFRSVYPDPYEVEVNDLGKIPPDEFHTGDIIYWTDGIRAYHIGMIMLGTGGEKVIAQSTGSSYNNCALNYLSLKRGVVLSSFTELMDGSRGKNFSKNYRIVRYSIQSPDPCDGVQSFTFGGQTYHILGIGDQCWMKENLNVGSMIPGDSAQKQNGAIEKYCYGNDADNCTIYGGLYQWGEAMAYTTGNHVRGICPAGWHMPADSDFVILGNALGGLLTAGGKMKEAGTAHWTAPNKGATNSSGFTALPAGFYWYPDHTFDNLGNSEDFWTTTPGYANNIRRWGVYYEWDYFGYDDSDPQEGLSVRCLKDDTK